MTHQPESMLKARKAIYLVSTLPALASVVTGTLEQQENRVLVAVATPYLLWVVLFGAFIWLSFPEMSKNSNLIITCFYHLLCVGATMAFLSSLVPNSGNALFLWTPIGTQVGILLAVGLQECASMISWRRIRRLVLSFLKGLLELMGAGEPQIPFHEHNRYTPPPRPRWIYTSNDAPEWHIMQTLSSTAPAALTASAHNGASPDDTAEDNPWTWR